MIVARPNEFIPSSITSRSSESPVGLIDESSRPNIGLRPILDCRAGPALDADTFFELRRSAILDGCKWDPQVGDVATLAAFPIIMRQRVWQQLARWAEELTAETLAAEQEILERPSLLNELGLPSTVRKVLQGNPPCTPAAARVLRFDFHPTTSGWRISEVNSDVPGGFTEGTHFTQAMARHYQSLKPAGCPADFWADAIAATALNQGPRPHVVLLAAPGYLEDLQIMAYLGQQLSRRSCLPVMAHPRQISWRNGFAFFTADRENRHGCEAEPVAALVRFYQGEWLARLSSRIGWSNYFRGGGTPVANPGIAIISESKRWPLVWDQLRTPLPRWRALLPETRTTDDAPWVNDDSWIIKAAFSNTGDDVSMRPLLNRREWLAVRAAVMLRPGRWLAQRRFESIPLATPDGDRHLCVGVYTIDGRAAGAYTRLTNRPLIDYSAVDAALLIEEDP